MALTVTGGLPISQITTTSSFVSSDKFVLARGTTNRAISYADMLTELASDLGTSNVLTTDGDLLTRDSGSNIRLGIGTNGQVLTVSSGLPSWQTINTGATELSGLTDVNTSTPTNKNVLIADGVDWESRPFVVGDINATGTLNSTTFLRGDGQWAAPDVGAEQLSDLSDVLSSTATNRNFLVANGTNWVSRAFQIADIGATGTASSSTFLRGDGRWEVPTVVATPGGSTTQIQFNNAGSFDGTSRFTITDSGTTDINVGSTSQSGNIKLGSQTATSGGSVTLYDPGASLSSSANKTSLNYDTTLGSGIEKIHGAAVAGESLYLRSVVDVLGDSGATPAILLSSELDSGAALAVRPFLEAKNYTTTLFEVAADGTWDFGANLLKNALDPVDAQDVATKNYVDLNVPTVAGSNTEIQYNNSGSLGASENLTFSSDRILTVSGSGGANTGLIRVDFDSGSPLSQYLEINSRQILSKTTGGGISGELQFRGHTITFWTNSGLSEVAEILSNGNWDFKNNQLTNFTVAANTPSSASDTGTAGEIAYDSDYIYICVATNTWKRAGLATWL